MTRTVDRPLSELPLRAMSELWLTHARLPFCVTDPTLPENPIVFINTAFSALTGYAPHEVIGRNCRFLQGRDTDPGSVRQVREMLESRSVGTVEILNYRKDGTPFLNALQIGPIYDETGALTHFFGSQLDITARREAERAARDLADSELLHRLRNIVNVMTVIIRLTAREETDTAVFGRKLAERMATLSEAHFRTLGRPGEGSIVLSEIASFVLGAYAPAGPAQFDLAGPAIDLPPSLLSPISLVLHELAANAVKHGALSTPGGKVRLTWQRDHAAGMLQLRWQESDGPGVIMPARQSGSRIISAMTEASGGTIEFDWRAEGLRVAAQFPLVP